MRNDHRKVPPAMDFWVDDWIGGTYWMTAEQCGCYLRLVLWQWQDGAIQNDENQMVLRTGVSIEVVRSVLSAKFELIDGVFINGKVKSVRDRAMAKLETLRQNGLKGGRPKKTKSKPDGFLTETKSKPNGKIEDRRSSLKKKKKEEWHSIVATELPFESADLRAAWREYIQIRIEKKYTLSARVVARLVNFLAGCGSVAEAVEVIDKAIAGGWKDFYPIKRDGDSDAEAAAERHKRIVAADQSRHEADVLKRQLAREGRRSDEAAETSFNAAINEIARGL